MGRRSDPKVRLAPTVLMLCGKDGFARIQNHECIYRVIAFFNAFKDRLRDFYEDKRFNCQASLTVRRTGNRVVNQSLIEVSLVLGICLGDVQIGSLLRLTP